ncbi:hypothetical protein LJC58_09440 [Lachnospiraceae bacterium OttesenSCG-928-D06]|nr:hypothetical protein [Lachnospiraceae bacterium OttesenSCG-928-D06]
MKQNTEFERCIDFLARMIEKYGDASFRDQIEIQKVKDIEINDGGHLDIKIVYKSYDDNKFDLVSK